MSGPESDSELVDRLKTGSEAAFNELYDRHAATVYRWLLSRRVGVEQAEDLLQEVFVVLWKKRRGVQIYGESLLPWLLTTARYETSNAARAARRRQEREKHAPSTPATQDVHLRAEHRAELRQVAATVARLSDIDQEVFRLCVLDGRSYVDAGHTLNLRSGAVRNRLYRIRQGLIQAVRPIESPGTN